jgi:hypothetical protein
MGKHPSMDWAARDIAAQSVDSHTTTSVWWPASNCIPSCRGVYGGAPVMIIPVTAQESKLMDQVLALFLYPYPSSISSNRLGSQA